MRFGLARLSGRIAALVALGFVAWLGSRVLFPRQLEDSRHLRNKERYLEEIASLAGGRPGGPNIVIILFDDLGYGDLGAYGSRAVRTPHLDHIAAAGVRFTDGYAASPYCSASRAGLLTGRHPTRMGFDLVLQPAWTWKDILLRLGARSRQLPAEEITLPEILRSAGFATALVGKWHLGDSAPSLPNDRGFERFFGLLYSNDQGRPVVWRDRAIAEPDPIDQATLTRRYTEEALAFLEANRDRPFFLYLAHTFPHVPLHASPEFSGRSHGGIYGDVVEELDASVGTVLDALTQLELAERTLVLVTSDNGPWFQGSAGGIRGRKMDVFEGGMRVPFLAYWPGRIAGNRVIADLVSGLDILPTVLELASLPLPEDRVIDGHSLVPVLLGDGTGPRRNVLYSRIGQFQAIREGRFKYHALHKVAYGNPMDWRWGPFVPRGPWLFDLVGDPDESYDVSDLYPAVTRRLAAQLERAESSWRQNPRGWREVGPQAGRSGG